MTDTLMVALINQSVMAPARPRRMAAGILLDMFRSGKGCSALPNKVERVEAEVSRRVADEMRVLIEEFGLVDDSLSV